MKIMESATIYIVLTVFNGEEYFLEQLMSIYFQEYKNWFLVIVDDGSTDGSLNIAKKFVKDYELEKKVKIIKQENQGTCKATENGLIEVQKIGKENDYVTYCDADDLRSRDKLKFLINFMNKNKDCDLCFHDISVVDQNSKIKFKSFTYSVLGWAINPYKNTFFELASVNHISPNIIYRVFEIKNIIPIKNKGAKDCWTGICFALNNKKIYFINEILGSYRIGHLSIQKQLRSGGNKSIFDRELFLFNKLKEKYPDRKEIQYFINYYTYRLHWIQKGYPKLGLIFSWINFPKRTLNATKNLLRYYITGKYRIK